jgi:hypothetical protein
MANSPVVPVDFKNVIPSTASSICGRFKLVLLQMPILLHKLTQFLLNFDGSVNSSFIGQIHKPGDLIFSASPLAESADRILCNGQEVSKAIHAALYSAIGDIYSNLGNADPNAPNPPPSNASNFRVPNFSGRSPVAVGVSTVRYIDINGVKTTGTFSLILGSYGGEETHALREPEGAMDHLHYHTTGKFGKPSGAGSDDWDGLTTGTSSIQPLDADPMQTTHGNSAIATTDTDTATGSYTFTGPVDNPGNYNWVSKVKTDFVGHNNLHPYFGCYVYIATGGITYPNVQADPNYND